MKLSRYTSGTQSFCIDRYGVRGVVEAPTLSAVPGAPPWLLGAYNHLGRAVAAVDVARLNWMAPSNRRVSYLILVDTGGDLVGLVADAPPVDHPPTSFPRRNVWIEVVDVRSNLLWIDLARLRETLQAAILEAQRV